MVVGIPVKELSHGHGLFLTLTWAENITLKFRTKIAIIFLQEENPMVHFWFCPKDGCENFEKIEDTFFEM